LNLRTMRDAAMIRPMQRLLVILTVTLLVAVSLGVGALSANWPFWHRAWQWHVAEGWPARLPGPEVRVAGGAAALPLQFQPDTTMATMAAGSTTQMLLRAAADGQVRAFFAPGYTAASEVDGRGLATAALVPLIAVLSEQSAGLLDAPIGTHISAWRESPRGQITPRQLLWQLSGLTAGADHPLNPFAARAQLAAGPDFTRAALRWHATFPPGTHFEESTVNAQLLAMVAAQVGGASYAEVLQRRLWSRFAAADAWLLLDHRRGTAAAHCCLRASTEDWMRLALLLGEDGRSGHARLWEPGFLAELLRDSPVHTGFGLGFELVGPGQRMLALGSPGRRLLIAPDSHAAVLWVGEGDPPAGLEQLLAAHDAGMEGTVVESGR
jgi:hypothetical protein